MVSLDELNDETSMIQGEKSCYFRLKKVLGLRMDWDFLGTNGIAFGWEDS